MYITTTFYIIRINRNVKLTKKCKQLTHNKFNNGFKNNVYLVKSV